MKTKLYEYGLEELLVYAESNTKKLYSAKTDDFDYFQSLDWKDGLDKVRNGYDLDKVNKVSEALINTVKTEESMVYDVQGSFVDVGAYMSGDPECMVDFVQTEAHKFIHLVCNVSEGWSVEGHQILNKAGVIIALIDTLEESGVRVRLDVNETTWFSKYETKAGVTVRVKDYHHPLSIAEIMGVFHPSFERRVLFSWGEMNYPKNCNPNSNYGVPREVAQADPDAFIIESVSKGAFSYETDAHTLYAFNAILKKAKEMV